MTLILSGTNGLSDVDGSASTPAIRGTDSNTGIFFPAADTIAFAEGGAEVMRIDSSGNFGLGVTPSAWTTAFKALNIGVNGQSVSADGGQIILGSNYVQESGGARYVVTAAAGSYSISRNSHIWYIAPSGTAGNAITWTQAMTLDSSGNLLVGTASSGQVTSGWQAVSYANGWFQRISHTSAAASGDTYISFQYNAGGIGQITQNGTTGVTYGTTSDYRLKENVQLMTGALAKVAALKPVTYKWKTDGSDGQGFIAHELAEVCPDAVQGVKDAVDAEGNPVYQGIDTSFLVATLTAAIQEQQALIESLTARIAALEAK